jgi:hypothetical protein
MDTFNLILKKSEFYAKLLGDAHYEILAKEPLEFSLCVPPSEL